MKNEQFLLYLGMKTAFLIIICLLLGVISWLYFRDSGENKPVLENKKAETIYNARLDSIHALRKVDFEKRKQDSIKSKVDEKAFKSEISRFKKKVAEKKVEAAPVIESNKNVMELVNYYDSTIILLESRIDTLQKEKETQYISFNNIISQYDEELKQNKMFIGQQSETIQVLSNDNKKLKRRSKALRVLIPVALFGGVLLAK